MTALKEEIDSTIAQATKKAKVSSMNELCKYIPDEDGYRMHHFSLKKLKQADPSKLATLLNKNILEPQSLKEIQGRPRTPGKKKAKLDLGAAEIQALLKLARQSNNTALVEKLQSSLPFSALKKQMLQSIKDEKIDIELWNSYVEFLRSRDNA